VIGPMRWLRRRARDDAGIVTTYVAIMTIGFLLVTGLVVDGGGKIATYMEASQLADGAARAGAQAVDQGALYANGEVHINPDQAHQLVNDYMAEAKHPGDAEVLGINGNTITVRVTLWQQAKILVGASRNVSATASATALRGVETGS
jgi:Putative Flp pilus-assembly TadE/G-like